jgi:xylulokinase
MQAAGGSLSWLKEQIGALESHRAAETGADAYELINQRMSLSPAGAHGLLYLPYLLGERSPRWNPLARGAFIGLKMEHKREDVFRAVMEGIALNLNIIYRILKSRADIREIIVIGGLAGGKIERQILADVYGTRVLKPTYLEEATSMGAAVTAGVGAGVFDGFDAVSRFLEIDGVHEPNPENHQVYQRLMPLFDACYHALKDVYEKMAES